MSVRTRIEGWKPKDYRRRNEHRIWHGAKWWFVNYCDDDIYGCFDSWQEAFAFLSEQLSKQAVS